MMKQIDVIAGLLVGAVALACGSACGDSGVTIDTGDNASANGSTNSGSFDSGKDDSPRDAGYVDAGDAGSTEPDAGSTEPDAGATDAAMTDDSGMDDVLCTTGSRDGVCRPTAECFDGFESVPGFCPGPADIQCCVPVDNSVCRENPPVAEMPQPNAGLVEAPGDAGCPAGMARLGGFCIDRWEAALVEVTSNGERPWSPYFNPGSRRVRAVSIDGAVPQAYVSGQQAAGACAEAGKRLCSDAEWLSACRGSADRIYPYGDTRQPGVCNDSRSVHPAIDYFGTSDDSVFSMLDNACIGQQQETVDPAGANASCVTPEGVFDMMGNLHEWTSDPAGTFRGGFYVDTVRNGDGCLYRTTAHGFGYWDYSTGFRCCADAQ